MAPEKRSGVLVIDIRPQNNSRPASSAVLDAAPRYDRLKPRLFEFVPLSGLAVWFVYRMLRVDC